MRVCSLQFERKANNNCDDDNDDDNQCQNNVDPHLI